MHRHQQAYYDALKKSTEDSDSAVFIEYMLKMVRDTLVRLAEETSGKLSGKTSGKTSVKIVTALQKNASLTIPELADALGVTPRSIERNLQKLQEQGRLRRVGPAKGGHWEVMKTDEWKRF